MMNMNISNSSLMESMETSEQSANSSVMEMAQEYGIYSAAIFISRYYVPVLVPIGMIGNTLSLLVMLQPHNRLNSCCNYMGALAVSDNCMMVTAVYLWVVSSGFARTVTFYECKVLAYAFNLFAGVGIYLIVCMTIDRFIAVRFPLQMPRICTVRRSRLLITVVWISMVLYTSPYIYTSGIINNSLCSTTKGRSVIAQTVSWLNVFVASVIPFCSLLVMNTIIVKTIVCRGRDKTLNKTQVTKGRLNSDIQLAVMLILISVAFLFLTLPVCIRYVLAVMLDHQNNPYHNALYAFVYHLSQKLYFTNNAVNFYLYCIGGAKFRADLLKVFCRKKKSQNAVNLSVSVSNIPTEIDTVV